MSDELFSSIISYPRLTVSDGLELLWRIHLNGKPSGLHFLSNRKALCKSFGHKFLDQLNEVDVIRHKQARLVSGVSIGTVGHDHTVITLLYNKLYTWKKKGLKIDGIDFSLISLPAYHPTLGIGKRKAPPRTVLITPEEFSRLIEHSTERLKDVLYFAIDTGIRRGDLMNLTLSNYNPQTGKIEFTQSKTKKWASIPASDRIKKIIQKAEINRKTMLLDFTNFDFEWRLAKYNAKLRHKQFRDLRRSNASEAYAQCHDLRKVRDLLGHSSERTTEEVYVISQKQDLKPLVDHIENTFT